MLTISKPLSAAQVRTYHAEEFANARVNYYSVGDQVHGQWHGRLAEQWGLTGVVDEEHFQRLAEGQHPLSGDPLVQYQTARTYVDNRGRTVTSVAHRAGWDATFSAPKSVSLTALVGADDRVRDAHRASVAVAVDELEHYVQARIGGNHPAETTGKWVAAAFEHDSARPVEGYAAPQLHTHVVFFNLTERENGETRPIQPRELYKTQQYATAVYRSELAGRLTALGYEIERGDSGQPEIRGYSAAYLEASSPRRQQIEAHLAGVGRQGAAAAQIAAHRTREAKGDSSREEMQQRHRGLAHAFGDEPSRVVAAAHAKAQHLESVDPDFRFSTQKCDPAARVPAPHFEQAARTPAQHFEPGPGTTAQELGRASPSVPAAVEAQEAVTFARERNFEREAVVDERALLRDALARSMGEVSVREVKAQFERGVSAGEFVEIEPRPGQSGRVFTTKEMIALERSTIDLMRAGRESQSALVSGVTRHEVEQASSRLNDPQRAAVTQILASRDRVLALEGVAGAGKTTTLVTIRDAVEREGYRVEGLAPTSRAALTLADVGIPSTTLQHHLQRGAGREEGPGAGQGAGLEAGRGAGQETGPGRGAADGHPRLYVLDESSLASTRQMHEFLHRLGPADRVLLVGDVRQHQAVEAGQPYQQLQEAGIAVVRLDHIVRQRDPALRQVVVELSRGYVRSAIHQLDRQGRVHEVAARDDRIDAIVHDYVRAPHATLVVSPDHRSRIDINQRIHVWLQSTGQVQREEHRTRVLVARQDVTGADRQWAVQYEPGNVVRFTRGSRGLGLRAGEYAHVHAVDVPGNRLTVQREGGELVTYDPARLQGVTLYREAERAFAIGDRIQFTAPFREQKVANRELGTLEQIDRGGHAQVRLDSGRRVAFSLRTYPHLDYGYAVTSHSSQGETADRVLVHVDTGGPGEQLINRRMAYVALSRGRYDAHIYTNDKAQLGQAFSRDVSHRSAIEPASIGQSAGHEVQPAATTSADPRQELQITITR